MRVATTVCPPIAPARLIHPRASSSVTSAKQAVLTCAPPHGCGIIRPNTPSSFIRSTSFSGYSSACASSRATGLTSRSTKVRTVSTIAVSSGLKPSMWIPPRSRPPPARPVGSRSGSIPRVRVLMLSWEYPPLLVGGLGRHVHALAEATARSGHQVTVLTRHPDPAGQVPYDEVRGGVRVVRVAEDPSLLRFEDELLAWTMALNHALTRA